MIEEVTFLTQHHIAIVSFILAVLVAALIVMAIWTHELNARLKDRLHFQEERLKWQETLIRYEEARRREEQERRDNG